MGWEGKLDRVIRFGTEQENLESRWETGSISVSRSLYMPKLLQAWGDDIRDYLLNTNQLKTSIFSQIGSKIRSLQVLDVPQTTHRFNNPVSCLRLTAGAHFQQARTRQNLPFGVPSKRDQHVFLAGIMTDV